MERMTLEVCEADRPVFSDITLAVSVFRQCNKVPLPHSNDHSTLFQQAVSSSERALNALS